MASSLAEKRSATLRVCCTEASTDSEEGVTPQFQQSIPTARKAPRISIHVSPGQPQLETTLDAATKINIDFVLESDGPVTLYVDRTILCPWSGSDTIHGDFDFVNTKDGTLYGPAISEAVLILDPNDYEVSYANSHRFVTLYTGVPYRLERILRTFPGFESKPMEAGESYQIKLKPDSESQQLWWSHGRKWQVLRWSSWPFGKPFNIYDFVCSHKGRDTLAPVQFSSDDHCIVKTLPWHESHAKEWNEVLALDKN